jgi:hypothetical protein
VAQNLVPRGAQGIIQRMLRAAHGCSGSEQSCTATAQVCLFIAQVTATCAQVSKWKWNLKRSRLLCEYPGIYLILVAGCIMLTPILNWSTTVRKHQAGAIIVYWGLLTFAALIATLTKLFTGGFEPFSNYTQLTLIQRWVARSTRSYHQTDPSSLHLRVC